MEKIFFDEWSATLDDQYFETTPDNGLEPKVKKDLRDYVMGRLPKDANADTLLFNAMGQLLNVGDTAIVKKDKALVPAHNGQTLTVTAINGRYATVTDESGATINGYEVQDMIKQTQQSPNGNVGATA